MISELLRGLFVLLPWSLGHFLLPEKTEKIVQKPKNLPPKLPLFGKIEPSTLPETMFKNDQEQTEMKIEKLFALLSRTSPGQFYNYPLGKR